MTTTNEDHLLREILQVSTCHVRTTGPVSEHNLTAIRAAVGRATRVARDAIAGREKARGMVVELEGENAGLLERARLAVALLQPECSCPDEAPDDSLVWDRDEHLCPVCQAVALLSVTSADVLAVEVLYEKLVAAAAGHTVSGQGLRLVPHV